MFRTVADHTLSLPHMLHEMDIALAAEIKAQENTKGKKHLVVDGKFLGEQNGLYLYKFSFKDEPWETDDDIPVKVLVRNSKIIKANIVKSTGLAITIETDTPLPPDILQSTVLFDDFTALLKRLKESLKSNEEGILNLGTKVLGLEASKSGRISSSVLPNVFMPDPSQQKAIQMALGSEVTYIVGPPGTGKTVTLAIIALDHLLLGHTVLVTSHTNIAVDNAIKQLADFCKKSAAIDYLREGRVVRFGATQLDDLKKPEYEDIYLPAVIKRRSFDLQREKETHQVKQKELEELLLALTSENEQKRIQWKTEQQQLLAQYQTYNEELITLQESEKQCSSTLNAEKVKLEKHSQLVRQEWSTVKQQLEWQVSRTFYLENEKGQLFAKQKEVSERLAAAQQKNKLTLILKGINPHRLTQELVMINQKIWEIDEEKKNLEIEINNGYNKSSSLQKQDQSLTNQINVILAQTNIPSPNIQTITNLQATVTYFKQKVNYIHEQHHIEDQAKQGQISQLKKQEADTNQRLDEIQKELYILEKKILEEARVVATTLSKTFMSSALSNRRFDVVIIDEVSMASLPAIYSAASQAESSVVVVGDPQQLPPIYHAKNSKKLDAGEKKAALSWLGTDLYTHNRITLERAKEGYLNSTILTSQSRMHPEISSIAIKHIYGGILQNNLDRVPKEQFSQVEPLIEKHLLLCDTSDASPIAIRPEHSRYNILHALCSLSIAHQVLSSLPDKVSNQEDKELIGIVTPYAKQADLLQILTKSTGIDKKVRVGTVHRFQGLEFDIVIFDTVESPDVAPYTDFIAGGKGTEALRLINVAVTRAKHKLIIVANVQHILNYQDHQWGLWFPNESILRKAIQEAKKSASINCLEILNLPPEEIMNLKSLSESDLSTLPAKWRIRNQKALPLPAANQTTYTHRSENLNRNTEDYASATRAGQQFGNYRLIRELGSGGFAKVYLAEHIYLNTKAAIKTLHTQFSEQETQNFLIEAQNVAKLKHPNIIRILDYGIKGAIPFLVMEYASNATLYARHPKGNLVPLATVKDYIKQIASALQYSHDEKLIHRDVKPQNMLLGSHNEVLLSDFGIAVNAHSTASMKSQEFSGTIAYTAPEQIDGKARPASDQYSLAIVVYEWLCGSCPFEGSNLREVAMKHIFTPPPPLHSKVPMISPEIEQVVLKALCKDPLQRFENIQAFANAIEQAH